jgi:translation initiation factor 2 beta subunit (eIF-2beta)/eIF-5
MLHKEFETAFNNLMLENVKSTMNTNDDNPRQTIEELLVNITKYNQLLVNFIIEILKEMDYKLLNEKGEFKKVGLFKWKNVGDYLAFAEFVKSKIIDVKNVIEK